jgi:CHAD domain-containing protein
MKAGELFSRWRSSQNRYLRDLDSVLVQAQQEGAAEQIHVLRVLTRRLRQLVRLGAVWHGRKAATAFREWSQGIARATDKVRDADVTLEWLAPRAGAGAAIAQVNRSRVREYRRIRLRLIPPPERILEALQAPAGGPKPEERLRRRLRRLEEKLRERLRAKAPDFFRLEPEAQHDFRRLVRRWRYLRELVCPKSRRSKDRRWSRLLELQEVLGERQNLQLARQNLGKLEPGPELEALRGQLETELRALDRAVRLRLAWLKGRS